MREDGPLIYYQAEGNMKPLSINTVLFRTGVLFADCTPEAETFRKLSPHLRKWERCDLGGKHKVRYCHLLLAPPFGLTPNEPKWGSLYKRVSMALKLF